MCLFDLERLSRYQRMATAFERRPKPLRTELRRYAPGDDFRNIDWPLCARRDELLTKTNRYHQERRFYIFLDCSANMFFGGPSKFRMAIEAAAMLSCSALQNESGLRLTAFADSILADSPIYRRPGRLSQVLEFLGRCACHASGVNLPRIARQWVARRRIHGPVVLLSDFFDLPALRTTIGILTDHGYLPRLVQIYAPCEADPALLGDVALRDAAISQPIEGTITQQAAKRYRCFFADYLIAVRDACFQLDVPLLQAVANMPEQEFLESVLHRIAP